MPEIITFQWFSRRLGPVQTKAQVDAVDPDLLAVDEVDVDGGGHDVTLLDLEVPGQAEPQCELRFVLVVEVFHTRRED